MKDIEDAVRIRSRVLLSFEAAEIEANPQQREAHLTFVIVGGGPTGVELAGALRELAVDVIPRDFRLTDTRRTRVILIEAGERLLPSLHERSSARALAQLEKLGVEVRLGQPVTKVMADHVEVGGERIRTFNTIWAAGVRASPLVETLGVSLGPGYRVKVERDCSIPKHPEAFVIGDAAFLVDPVTGHPIPGVSQGAIQMGRFVADVIRDEIAGRAELRRTGFRYRNRGSMATIGRARAVAEFDHLRFGGFLAWLLWLLVHITALIGFRNRIGVLAEWAYNYVFGQRGSRLITGLEPGHIDEWVLVSRGAPPAHAANEPKTPGSQLEERGLGE